MTPLWKADRLRPAARSAGRQPGQAATANAQPPQASSELDLTISEGPVPIAAPRARTLICDPPGGNHPYPEAACFDIAAAQGDLARLPGQPGKACGGVYKPVTVTALGEWQGVPVRFHDHCRRVPRELRRAP
ncbi:SSI family serine proteinase inhibitor [Kibdelosporangium aridum]|uniref:SSI family serine proteinase inhibitor n=1 Tax=Kibdelosporangium aridum TaxID=2030 RepID=UPI00163B9E83